MKYYCYQNVWIEGKKVLSEGEVIVVSEDKKSVYSITRGLDIEASIDQLLPYLNNITDDYTYVEYNVKKSDADKFEEITKKMLETFKKKNHDYGNSFEESLNEEGITAARIRIGDKWNRFKTLSKGIDIKVNDESISDTLLDLANYCILTKMWLDGSDN